jgi:hypothetical protein
MSKHLCCPRCGTIVTCGCESRCGDDGDVDGPGICKRLPRMSDAALLEIVLVPKEER